MKAEHGGTLGNKDINLAELGRITHLPSFIIQIYSDSRF